MEVRSNPPPQDQSTGKLGRFKTWLINFGKHRSVNQGERGIGIASQKEDPSADRKQEQAALKVDSAEDSVSEASVAEQTAATEPPIEANAEAENSSALISQDIAAAPPPDEPPLVPQPSPLPLSTKPKTYRMPQGSRIKPLHENPQTKLEHGEKTWTTAQSIRDIMQNHLDANTRQYFDRLVAAVLDTDKLDPEFAKQFDDFTYLLFIYKKGLGSFSPETEHEIMEKLSSDSFYLPVRAGLRQQGKLDSRALKTAITPVKEDIPKVSFRITDSLDTPQHAFELWVTYDELKRTEALQERANDDFRYAITGMKIEDQGTGFDSKLTAFYHSTKRGQRHLRGKFGEGSKMSETHLLRHNAFVKMRSRFEINGGEPRHERIWQHRAYIGENQTVQLKGIQVDLPPGLTGQAGSYTLITIDRAGSAFQKDFRANVDPRLAGGGLGKNCLEYSDAQYLYPVPSAGYVSPVGISLDADPHNQYVQGLRVEASDVQLLFSYDFLDSSVLKGRDRSELNNVINAQIKSLWQNTDSPALIREVLIKMREGEYSDTYPPAEISAIQYNLNNFQYAENPQARRAAECTLKMFPQITGAKENEKNIYITGDQLYENRQLAKALKENGYNIVVVKVFLDSSGIKNLNNIHEGRYLFYNMAEAAKELDGLRKEIGQDDERVQDSLQVFRSALTEMAGILKKTGVNQTEFNINPEPKFMESATPLEHPPFALVFDPDQNKFHFEINFKALGPILKYEGGTEYWKKRIQVDLLSTYKRNTSFKTANDMYMAAQETANMILRESIHPGLPDADAVPSEFHHIPNDEDMLSAISKILHDPERFERGISGFETYLSACKFELTFEESEAILEKMENIPAEYAEAIKNILNKRVLIEKGVAGYFDKETEGTLKFKKVPLDSLVPECLVKGKPVYRLGDKLFIHYELPEKSVITNETQYQTEKLVMFGGSLIDMGRLRPYIFDSYPLTVERSGFVISLEGQYFLSDDEKLKNLEDAFRNFKITSPEQKASLEMRFLEGEIPVSISTNYGIGEWDNGVRVFQDAIQNHEDASPDGNIELRYEVKREANKVWVKADEVGPWDEITGFMVSDRGGGYAPDNLGLKGNTSKKSPIFAGKYGEGQKMIAASAVRNGIELSFSSVANFNGRSCRWEAKAGSKPVLLYVDGKPTYPLEVIFNVSSREASSTDNFTSSTIIRCPDGNADSKAWDEWLQVLDPRNKDDSGEGGLARYILPLRASRQGIIDLGFMKILPDEPGRVYENGLLVARDENTAFGYDVWDIVANRERNALQPDKLKDYIKNAAYACPDPRFADYVIKKLTERYAGEFRNPKGPKIKEIDLDIGRFDLYTSFIPAKPFWQQASNSHLENCLVYSEEELHDRIRRDTGYLKDPYSSARDIQNYKRGIQQAYAALANVRHIPSENLIYTGAFQYRNWIKFLPSVEDFAMDLAEKEVPANEETIKILEGVISEGAKMLGLTITQLRTQPGSFNVFKHIVAEKELLDSVNIDNKVVETKLSAESWTPEELAKEPHRVFVSPANAGYLGLATRNRIGINELLLTTNSSGMIPQVVRHELVHKVLGLRDYTPEFVMMLLESAITNLKTYQVRSDY